MYYIFNRHLRLWVRQYKVMGTSIDWAIAWSYNDVIFRPHPKLLGYLPYEWYTVIREPLDRLRSYWTAKIPPKQKDLTFRVMIEQMLEGKFLNPHVTPQWWLVKDFKKPEVIVQYEKFNEQKHLIEGKFHPTRLIADVHDNPSPLVIPPQELFIKEHAMDLLPDVLVYYKDDYTEWGCYDYPAI